MLRQVQTLKNWLSNTKGRLIVPNHLHINGRTVDQNFDDDDLLYRGFSEDDFDDAVGQISTASIKFPDFSCNWNRYSEPADIHFRENGNKTDGCYSFSVLVSKFSKMALPVHDPLDVPVPNYSHVELRATREADKSNTIPPQGRRINSKTKKLLYRENMALKSHIELMPKPTRRS